MDIYQSLENILSVPPDGGWGWMIVAVSFFGIMLVDVPTISFQVVLPFLQELFDYPASVLSLVFSIYTLFMYITGPVAAGICNRFGFRVVAVVGSIVMIAGLIPLMSSRGYICFICLYGVVAGIGAAFVFLVCSVAPGFWFETKRAISLGLAGSATGLSLIVVSFSDLISDKYGWRYCFLFWSILAIVMFFLSVFLWETPMIELAGEEIKMDRQSMYTVTAQDVVKSRKIIAFEGRSMLNERASKKLSVLAEATGIPLASSPRRVESRYGETEKPGCCQLCLKLCHFPQTSGGRPFYRKDIFYQGSLFYANELEHVPSTSYTLRLSKLPTTRDMEEETKCSCKIPEAVTRTMRDMTDLSLLKSWVFLVLVVATFFAYLAIYIPFLQIKKVNKGKMGDDHVEVLLIIMGIGLITFRITIGFILIYFPKIGALFVLVLASLVGGLVFCAVPLSHEVPYQFILAFCGGAFPAVIIPLRSVVAIEQVGVDRLTSCMGNLFFVQGVACFIGVPVAEFLIETTGWIYSGIVFSGVCYILAGISFAFIGIVNRLEDSPLWMDSTITI